MVLGAGLLLAFLTLIAEVLCKRKRKQKVIENSKKVFNLKRFEYVKKYQNHGEIPVLIFFLTRSIYIETCFCG